MSLLRQIVLSLFSTIYRMTSRKVLVKLSQTSLKKCLLWENYLRLHNFFSPKIILPDNLNAASKFPILYVFCLSVKASGNFVIKSVSISGRLIITCWSNAFNIRSLGDHGVGEPDHTIFLYSRTCRTPPNCVGWHHLPATVPNIKPPSWATYCDSAHNAPPPYQHPCRGWCQCWDSHSSDAPLG